MIIVLKQEAKNEDVTRIEQGVKEKGLEAHISKGENQTIIGLVGDTTKVDPESIEVDPAVEKVMHVSEPYKLANRAFHPEHGPAMTAKCPPPILTPPTSITESSGWKALFASLYGSET